MAGTDATDLRIFKWSQNPGHECRRPSHVVVGHDCNRSLDLGQGFTNLKTLIGNGGIENPDLGIRKRVRQLLEILAFVVCGDENQLSRLTSEDALERWPELLKDIVNSRDDNGDIFAGKSWLIRYGLGLINPVAHAVDKQSEVAMDPRSCLLDDKLRPIPCPIYKGSLMGLGTYHRPQKRYVQNVVEYQKSKDGTRGDNNVVISARNESMLVLC